MENQETIGDRSQNDPDPEVEFSACQSRNSIDSDPEEVSHTKMSPIEKSQEVNPNEGNFVHWEHVNTVNSRFLIGDNVTFPDKWILAKKLKKDSIANTTNWNH